MEHSESFNKETNSQVLLRKFSDTRSVGGQLSLLTRFALRAVVPLFDALRKSEIDDQDFIAAIRRLNELINLEPMDFARLKEVELNPMTITKFKEPVKLGETELLSHGTGKYSNSVAMSLQTISATEKIYLGMLDQVLHSDDQHEKKISIQAERISQFFDHFCVSFHMLRGSDEMGLFLDANYLGMAEDDAIQRDQPHDVFDQKLFDQEFSRLIAPELENILRPQGVGSFAMGFWYEWYQGYLEGRPIDWELQRRVAMIDDAVWDEGPKAAATEIEKIRAQFELESRIEELEAELRHATFSRHGMGGNMPPEKLEGSIYPQELVIIWQPLEDLKGEIAKDVPDPERLKTTIAALVKALKQGSIWCLNKADLIVETAIKWAIPAGGTGYLALNPSKIEAVIEATKKLLNLL